MSNTNITTNIGQNRNQNSRRGGRGWGDPTGGGRGYCRNGPGNKIIAKCAFKGKMKDGPISKLSITKTGHRPTQFKKITDTLPVLCIDKNFQGLDEVLRTNTNLDEGDFMPFYLDANQGSTTYHVKLVLSIRWMDVPLADGLPPAYFEMMEQIHVFDANFQ